MEELLAKMACLLQDIYDEGHGGEFRPSIQEVLVRYNAAQQDVHWTVAIESLEDSPWATGVRNSELALPIRPASNANR